MSKKQTTKLTKSIKTTKTTKTINSGGSNDRFNALKEPEINPFKVASSKQRNKKQQEQNNITDQKEQLKEQLKEQKETAYVPISQRRKNKKDDNLFINIESLPPKRTVNTKDQMAFPTIYGQLATSTTPTTPTTPKNCWNRAGVDIVKSKHRTTTKTENTNSIPPGWVRISKSGTVYGPPPKNQETTFVDTKFRTYCLEYFKLAKRNRQIVMDDLEVYGDEYYHLFGDPEELLNDEDSAFADEDDTSFGDEDSYDGYDRDSGTED